MKKLATLSLLAVAAFAISACGPTVKDYDGTEVQGVSEDKILVGNTAATTGAFATVGVPFNQGLEAALKVYNDQGGFKGKKVELKHYVPFRIQCLSFVPKLEVQVWPCGM